MADRTPASPPAPDAVPSPLIEDREALVTEHIATLVQDRWHRFRYAGALRRMTP